MPEHFVNKDIASFFFFFCHYNISASRPGFLSFIDWSEIRFYTRKATKKSIHIKSSRRSKILRST